MAVQLPMAELERTWACDKRRERRTLLVACGITLAVFLVCLGFKYECYDFPGVFWVSNYTGAFQHMADLLSGLFSGERVAEMEAQLHGDPTVVEDIVVNQSAFNRLLVTIMALLAGAGIAVASAIFQTVYRNPLASPNMLGATTGVQMGNVIMVVLYGSAAVGLVVQRYELCYGLSAVCVLVVLIIGRLAGDKRGNPSVLQMVMAGSVINQGVGVVTMYLMYNLPEENMLVFQELGMGTNLQLDWLSLALFLGFMLVSLVPVLVMRYKLNVVGLEDAEARTSGVSARGYRTVAQVCGVIMVAAATIHCGQAGMLGMVIPYIVRGFVGSNFKKVLTYSALSGGVLMMVCRTVTTSIPLHNAAGELLLDANFQVVTLPVTFIVNILLLPVFVWILIKQQRVYE